MELEKKTSIAILLDFYLPMLTERQAEIMQFYYSDDLSLSEVAELTGISRQGARDAIKKSEMILASCEQKLRLAEKYARQSAQIEEIVAALRTAKTDANIERQIEKIRALLG